MTPNRSAGRIEDPLWQAFLAKCQAEGLSNTDGMRAMIRLWTGQPGGPHPAAALTPPGPASPSP